MATPISGLIPITTPASGDLLPIVDVSDTTASPEGTTRSITFANFSASLSVGNLTGDVTSVGLATTIAANAVTNAKAAQMADSTIKGRAVGAGTGNPTDLTAAQATAIINEFVGDSGSGGTKGLVKAPSSGDATKFLRGDATWQTIVQGNLSGDVTSSGLVTTIATGAVTESKIGTDAVTVTKIQNSNITNAKLVSMVQARIKGRASGAGTGEVTDLTGTEATAILDAFVGDSGSGGTKGLVPAPIAGDSTKFLKGDGTWATPGSGGGLLAANNLSDVANVATSRSNLGLAIGTNVQAYNANTTTLGNTTTGTAGSIVLSQSPVLSPVDGNTFALRLSGSWSDLNGGGSGDPQLKIDAPNSGTWGTSGTGLALNAQSGFVGRLIDARVNDSVKHYVDYNGAAYFASTVDSSNLNKYTLFTGPTTSAKTKTLRDATDTILELGGSYTPTGTWTNLTLVTPVLGTPTSGNLANCTGVPHPTGMAGDTTSSNVIADVSGGSFSIAASETRYFFYRLFGRCSGAGGTKWAINAPSGATVEFFTFSITGSMLNTGGERSTSLNTLGTAYNTGTNVDAFTFIYGRVVNSTNAGSVALRWASGTNTQTSTIYAGSSFEHHL